MFRKFWEDCEGSVITTELVLVASFVTAILIAGLGALKSRISSEFEEIADVVETAHESSTVSVEAVVPLPQGIEIAGPAETFFQP